MFIDKRYYLCAPVFGKRLSQKAGVAHALFSGSL